MSLTAKQETELKLVVAEREKQKAIDAINQTAYQEIGELKNQIQAREDKRITDIQAVE